MPASSQHVPSAPARPARPVLFTEKWDFFSSHPWWLERGSRFLSTAVILGFTMAWAILVLFWLGGDNPQQLAGAVVDWVFGKGAWGTALLLLFLLGFAVTNAFTLRWAGAKANLGIVGAERPVRRDMAAYLAFLGIILPLLLGFLPGLPLMWRLAGGALALLPVAFLTLVIRAAGNPPQFPLRLSILCGILLLTASLFAIGGDRPATLAPEWLRTIWPRLATCAGWRDLCLVLLLPCAVLTGFRLLNWWAFHRRDDAAPAPRAVEDRVPQLTGAQLQEIIATVPGLRDVALLKVAPAAEQSCRFETNSNYAPLFGSPPTADQHHALESFLELGLVAESRRSSGRCADMIVQGPEGSGRSLLLAAMALAAVLLSGRRSLLLCSDPDRAKLMIALLEARLAALGMTGFVRAGGMEAVVQHLTDPEKVPPPEVCVTTLGEWEETFSQSAWTHPGTMANTLAVMLTYEVLLVDDWAECGQEIAAHLPVFADKRRLLLGSWGLPFQAVFCFPPLEKSSENSAFRRLLDNQELARDGKHRAVLRYRSLPPATVLRVRCTRLAGFLQTLALALAERDLEVTVFRRGIDANTARIQSEELSRMVSTGTGSIAVRHVFDDCNEASTPVRVALLESLPGNAEAAAVSIRAHDSSDALWIITVEEFSDEPAEPSHGASLIFLDRAASGVWEIHLRALLRFLPQRRPVDLSLWNRLGLLQFAAASDDPLPAGAAAARILFEDGAGIEQAEFFSTGAYLREFPRMAGVMDSRQPHCGVDPWSLPGDGRSLRCQSSEPGLAELLVLSDARSSAAAGPEIAWFDDARNALGTAGLAHLRDLVWRRGRNLAAFKLKIHGANLQIEGQSFRGDGTDMVHPRVKVRWQSHSPGAGDPTPLQTLPGGPGCQWIDCPDRDLGTAHVTLAGRCNSSGEEGHCPEFAFSFPASARLLLLRPAALREPDRKAFDKECPGLWSRSWSVEDAAFLPALTFAVHAWLEEEFRGILFFGKVLAFRLTGDCARFARALLVFIEPDTTGHTLTNHLMEFLSLAGNVDRFFKSVDHRLESGWDKSRAVRLARFWLPAELRRDVTLFERRLLWDLGADEQERGVARPGRKTLTLRVTCQVCGKEVQSLFHWGDGVSHIPHCNRLQALAAPGSEGRAIRPNDFLLPWMPPVPVHGRDRRELALNAWRAVAARMRYRHDTGPDGGPADCWLFPSEAWEKGAGDCEDHSILLVGILRYLGIPAWLTCGSIDDGHHVWVTLTLDGIDYLVEATAKNPEALVPESEAAARFGWTYHPEWRCNGTDCQLWQENRWQDCPLAEFTVVES